MNTVYAFKPRFQAILRPLCARLAGAGITANQVTLAALALSAVAGAWIAIDPLSPLPFLVLPLVLLVRMALNAMDGVLAREFGEPSALGAMLNELGDVVSDVLLYLPFGFHPAVPWWAVGALILTSILAEMTGIIAVQIGASRRYDGPFGKSDRALAFGALALLLGLGFSNGAWIVAGLTLALALSAVTIWNRARAALRQREAAT